MSGHKPDPAQGGTRSQSDLGKPDCRLQKFAQDHISNSVYQDIPPDAGSDDAPDAAFGDALEQWLLGLRPVEVAQSSRGDNTTGQEVVRADTQVNSRETHPFSLFVPDFDSNPHTIERRKSGVAAIKLTVFPQLLSRLYVSLRQWICTSALMEYQRGTVFLLMAVSSGGGALFYFGLEQEPHWAALGFAAVLCCSLWLAMRKKLLAQVLCGLILAGVFGMISAKIETWRHATPMLGGEVSTILTLRIISMEEGAENEGKRGFWRVIGDVVETDKPKLRHAPQRLRLSSRDLPAQAEIGTILRGAASLRPHGGPVRPGQYDFAFHGFFRDIGGNGFFLGTPKHLSADHYPQDAGLGWQEIISGWIAQMRANIGGRIMQALPDERGAIAAALIAGQRAGISESTNEALRMAGLAHILSISGLHLALAAGVVMVSVRFLAGLIPSLALFYPVKKFAALISLFSSAFYLAVSGGDVAAQRSFIMLSVMLFAVMLDRQALTMRNLAIAALFSIALTPHEILGPSFQMSYSATGALIAAFAWSKMRRQKKLTAQRNFSDRGLIRRWSQTLLTTVTTSLVAGTASGLYAAYHFNNMAPLGMLGNALALPVISILVMPFAVMALLVMPLGAEWLPLQVMGAGVELIKLVAHFVSDISPDLTPGLLPVPVLLIWTAALLSAMLLVSSLRWLSIALVFAGYSWLLLAPRPDIAISEDGKLLAIIRDDKIYMNRSRPAQFTISNWQKAYSAANLIIPDRFQADQDGAGFLCEGKLCLYSLASGEAGADQDEIIIAHAGDAAAALNACAVADVVVLNFSGPQAQCETTDKSNRLVITKQMLALKGATEIYLPKLVQNIEASTNDQAGQPEEERPQIASLARLVHAVGAPQRPWHLYRLYSRAARNKEDTYKK